MSWEAGSVVGSLGFNISDYAHGMIEAETIMRAFPPVVAEFLESPMLAVVGIAREMASAIGESVNEVMNTARAIDLAAQKAGMGVEQFSRLAQAAKFVDIGVEQLGVGMRMMQLHASDAVSGVQEAKEAFMAVGLSTEFLRDHLNDTGALFDAVQKAIDRIPAGADRTAAAMHLLGRSGTEMIPFLSMGAAKIRELANEAQRWGAVETEESAGAASAWKQATVQIGFAWEGIKKQFAESIAPRLRKEMDNLLGWVQTHGPEIQRYVGRIADFTIEAINALTPVVRFLLDHLEGVVLVLGSGALLRVVSSAITSVNVLGNSFVGLAEKIGIATAAENAFVLAKAALATGGIGGAIGGLTTGSMGGTFGGAIGGIIGGALGTAVLPGVGTYIGAAAGGFIGGTAGDAIQQHYTVNAHFDPKETADQFADRVEPQIREQYNHQSRLLAATASHSKVARALGGRGPSQYRAGM